MKNKLRLIFHSTVLTIYVLALIWHLTCLDLTLSKDERILDMHRYREKYFTGWNFTLHLFYFSLALSEDIHEYIAEKSWRHISWFPITYLKSYIFIMLIVPCSVFVTSMFWSLYHYDRELIYPAVADELIPGWFNHIIHSYIFIFTVLEFCFIGHHPEVSFRSALIGMVALNIAYYAVFFDHYFTNGRFLYPIFHQFTWYQMTGFIVGIFVCCLVVSKAGIKIQSWIREVEYTKNKI